MNSSPQLQIGNPCDLFEVICAFLLADEAVREQLRVPHFRRAKTRVLHGSLSFPCLRNNWTRSRKKSES